MKNEQKSGDKSEIQGRKHNKDDDDDESGIYERYTSVRYDEYNEQEKDEINKTITVR